MSLTRYFHCIQLTLLSLSSTVNKYPESSHSPSINISHDATDQEVADSNNDEGMAANSNSEKGGAMGEEREEGEGPSNELTVGQRLKQVTRTYTCTHVL